MLPNFNWAKKKINKIIAGIHIYPNSLTSVTKLNQLVVHTVFRMYDNMFGVLKLEQSQQQVFENSKLQLP